MMQRRVPFRFVPTGALPTDQAQILAQRVAQKVADAPWGSGVSWVKRVDISTLGTLVNHGLGRTCQGFLITRVTGVAASLCEAATQPADTTKQITLVASDPGATFDICFF